MGIMEKKMETICGLEFRGLEFRGLGFRGGVERRIYGARYEEFVGFGVLKVEFSSFRLRI